MLSEIPFEKSVSCNRAGESHLLQYAHENRNCGFFNDVVVGAGDELISANRMVLSCYSRFFEDMFRTNEQYEYTAEIADVDGKSVKIIIDYIYSGIITINNENILKLLETASKLKLTDVQQFCFDYLESILSTETCFIVLQQANQYNCESLKQKVFKHISNHFKDISYTKGFKNLSRSDIISCITSIDRSNLDEMQIYKAVVAWVKYDQTKRDVDFPQLLQLLKLDQFPVDFLTNIVSEEELVKDNLTCSNYVMNSLSHRLKDSQIKTNGSVIVSIGGSRSSKSVIEIFNIFDKAPKEYPDLPISLCAHSCLMLNNVIYVLGGQTVEEDPAVSNKVFQMNLNKKTLSWEELSTMNEKRWLLSATTYQDTLVVAGGSDEEKRLSSVEIFIMPIVSWKMIAELNECRSGHALVACRKSLYAIGGWKDGKTHLSSVERLEGLNGKWKYVESMQTPRRWLSAVSYKGFIYATGGRASKSVKSRLRSVEVYDPVKNEWNFVKDMNFKRNSHSSCVLNDKIYVVGGVGSDGKVLNQIECYDPITDRWEIIDNLEMQLSNHCTVVL